MSYDRPSSRAPRRRGFGWLGRLLLWLFAIALIGPPLLVLAYRFVPPPVTILQLQRAGQNGIDKQWLPMERIDPDLVGAVIAAEDSRFCEHRGFDVEAIKKAMESNERGGKVRGGSTISQQTAKNVFLWPQRSWVRKGLEAYFTVLTEVIWGKRRIMEVYLNVIEMGPGVYGAEAAAQKWFGKSAESLTRQEASRLAAILPSPLRYKAAAPGPYVRRRAGRVQAAIRVVNDGGLAACVYEGGRIERRSDEPAPQRIPPKQIDIDVLEEAMNPPAADEALPAEPTPYEALPPGEAAEATEPAAEPPPQAESEPSAEAPPPEQPAPAAEPQPAPQ